MKTFIFVDRIDTGLEPLTGDTCSALLPVAGKAVIDYTIEDLARAGIREAVIVASAHATRVEEHLGKGERWGMSFDYFPGQGAEHPASLLQRYAGNYKGPVLLIRGDVLRSNSADFIISATTAADTLSEACINDEAIGICLSRTASTPPVRQLQPPSTPSTWKMPAGQHSTPLPPTTAATWMSPPATIRA